MAKNMSDGVQPPNIFPSSVLRLLAGSPQYNTPLSWRKYSANWATALGKSCGLSNTRVSSLAEDLTVEKYVGHNICLVGGIHKLGAHPDDA